jgi:dCMP deaminase
MPFRKQLEWDLYFLRIARETANKSHCLSRKIGAVLVRDKNIISTGYNGPARGIKHCDERTIDFYRNLDNKGFSSYQEIGTSAISQCPRKFLGYQSGQGLHLCQAGHAERNALIQAAKHGIATKDASLYCYCCQVCKECAIEIINADISELIYLEGEPYDKYAGILLEESKIVIRQIKQELLT